MLCRPFTTSGDLLTYAYKREYTLCLVVYLMIDGVGERCKTSMCVYKKE